MNETMPYHVTSAVIIYYILYKMDVGLATMQSHLLDYTVNTLQFDNYLLVIISYDPSNLSI